GAQPYSIGPVSIGMRQNPYGSRIMLNPKRERITMAGDDPRQHAQHGSQAMQRRSPVRELNA
ncbi:hypothetical protein, partial [Caballeronia sp.]|uniref:hypothetical protein n=1 Tax=Caballeronia sp. TaxID=1931223 RepID=UPI003C4AEC01